MHALAVKSFCVNLFSAVVMVKMRTDASPCIPEGMQKTGADERMGERASRRDGNAGNFSYHTSAWQPSPHLIATP
jgi:hypothetical protein